MARPREAVGCRTLICRKADSGQLNDLVYTLVVDKRCAVSQEYSTRTIRNHRPFRRKDRILRISIVC